MSNDQAKNLRDLIAKRMLEANKNKNVINKTRTIAITSGKGGVGKSNISINLGIALKKFYENIVLFDADMGLANIDVLLGLAPKYTLADVIAGRMSINDIIINAPGGIKVIPGTTGIEEMANLGVNERNYLINEMMKLNFADIIIIDTAAGLSENVTNFVYAAREVIVVTTGEPTAFTDAYAMVKAVLMNNPNSAIYLLVNMINSESEAREVFQGLNSVVEKFLKKQIKYLGFIVRDSKLEFSVLQQKPVILNYPDSMVSVCFHNLAFSLNNLKDKVDSNVNIFFEKLLGAKSENKNV